MAGLLRRRARRSAPGGHSVAETSVAAVGTPRAVVERGGRETCRAQMRAAEGPVRQSGPCPGRSGPSVAPSPRACASRALRGLVWASLSREAPLTRLAAPIEREKQEGGSSTANQCAGSVPSGCRFGRAASASFPRLAGLCEPVRASLCNVTPRDCQASCSWLQNYCLLQLGLKILAAKDKTGRIYTVFIQNVRA